MGRISADDADLWGRAMRHVAPLPGRDGLNRDRRHPAGLTNDTGKMPAVPSPTTARDRGRFGHLLAGEMQVIAKPQAQPLGCFAGVDRATAERVKRGRYPVAARLDLHGMTQEEAHRALARFIATSRSAGGRCVLVITGHGRMSGGILKTAVPRWLAEPEFRRHVLALASARPQHGGDGALYILLRRMPS